LEDSLASLESGFGINDPVLPPDGLGKVDFRKALSRKLHELGAKQPGESEDRDEESAASGKPGFVVGGEASPRDEAMKMRVMDESPGPGVEHGHDSDHASDITRILGRFHEGERGGPHKHGEKDHLVGSYDLTKLLGNSKDEVEARDGEQLGPPYEMQRSSGVTPTHFTLSSV
jgi:hypothetical protein